MMKLSVLFGLVLGVVLSSITGLPLDPSPNPSSDTNKVNHAHGHDLFPNPAKVEALDLLLRITRQATTNNNNNSNDPAIKNGCKYRKGSWSACDPKTKLKTRTFTLKKGDANVCQSTKTLQRGCKGNRKGGKGKTGPKYRGAKGGNSNRTKTNEQ